MELVRNKVVGIDYSSNEKYVLSRLQVEELTIKNLIEEKQVLRKQLNDITNKDSFKNISYKEVNLLKDSFHKKGKTNNKR